jgi:DNA-binding response OmpR family regulator
MLHGIRIEGHVMKKKLALAVHATEGISVLSISPVEEDHASLKRILNHSAGFGYTSFNWAIYPSGTLESASSVLRKKRISIVVCEQDLSPGTWKQVLTELLNLTERPLLIVTSRLADERLWSEVLNLGGWDLLAKPFNGDEVRRVLEIAWSHWRHDTEAQNAGTATTKIAAAL